jgi:glycosyltransferase involved in cell wall biosynthesis
LTPASVDVSVLTPSLGYGRFIEDNIVSVRRQEELSIQHVVQDGGSTDGTIDVLRRHSEELEWVSEPDAGQSDALNKAFARSTGRWVAWLNADEFYLPRGLTTLAGHGDRTGADVVYGDNVFVDAEGRLVRLLPQHPFSQTILRLYGCFISSSSTIFRRSALPNTPWDLETRMIMDWELFLNLASRGARFSHVRYPVGAFRRHREQVTARPSSEFRDEYARVFERYGIEEHRRWGRWLHGAAKAGSRAYRRQRLAEPFRGRDMRWFMNEDGRASFDALLSACYGAAP